MDKRYRPASPLEQEALRERAIAEVLAHPAWSLAQSVRHLKTTMRLTTADLAKLSDVSFRTLQDIERGKSEGTVKTMNRILGVVGLKLGIVLDTENDDDL